MKRILFTVSNDLNYDQRMQRICTSLQNNGYDVLLVGRKRKASPGIVTRNYQQARLPLLFEKGKLFYIELNIRLFFYLLFKKFDVVCGIDLDTILPCYFVAKLKSKKCVLDAHELFTEVPELNNRPFVKSIWTRAEKFICRRIKYTYTVSQSVADEFKRRYNAGFEVIRNLPYKRSQDVKASTTYESSPIILYRGAVNMGRGLEATILAMKNINARLIVAGDGDLLDKIKRLTTETGLEQKVVFTGYQTPEQLDKLTLQATIGFNLLEADSKSYYYSLANKFLDYIQCNVPQVCMNFPEYERLNNEYHIALLIDEATPEKIETAINNILADNKLRNELVLNCTRAATELCWENEEKKLIDFYKHL